MDKPTMKQEDKAQRENDERKGHRQHQKKRFDRDRKPQSHGHGNSQPFRGEHEDLKGFVYTYDSAARANQYEKTTEKVAEWTKKELSFCMDIWRSIIDLKEPQMETWKPKAPVDGGDMLEKAIFGESVKEYMLRKRTYDNNRSKVYTVVLGQCSEAMKAKIEGQDNWEIIHREHDLVKLLKSIKVWMLNQQGARSPVQATYSSLMAVFRMRQNRHEELIEFRKRFVAATQVLEHIGVKFGGALEKIANKILKEDKKLERSDATKDDIKEAEEKALEKLLAVAFINAADRARYQEVTTDLENEFLKGSDQYPEDITSAYNMLTNWKQSTQHTTTPFNDGISFAQGSTSGNMDSRNHQGERKGGWDRSNDICHSCGIKGHHQWENKCEDNKGDHKGRSMHAMTNVNENDRDQDTEEDENDYKVAFCMSDKHAANTNEGQLLSQKGGIIDEVRTDAFNKKRAYVIPEGSVGLDSMSSVDVFGEKRLLKNIRKVRNCMKLVCNAGTVIVTQMGTFPGYGEVWYHPAAIANILSLSNVQRHFKVTFNSDNGNQFVVHRPDGTNRIFSPTEKGLYASDVNNTGKQIVMVSTVDENKKSFTRREVKKAEAARRLMAVIGRPGEHQMYDILDKRQLLNCNINSQDVRNARSIFGPEVGSLKGKTVRTKEAHVELTSRPIPSGVMYRHREVTVCFDVMYINGTAFLVSISRALKFCTAEAIQNRRIDTLLVGIKRIKMTYARRGFVVNKAAGDNEFSPLETGLSGIGVTLNTVSRDEHVPEIERHIRTLKERCRATYNSLPFRRLPNRMIVELVYSMTLWLHAFPARDGVSSTISPRELVTGVTIDASRHCVIPFGAYVQTHEQHDNTMAPRTIGALALRPTGNQQGGHHFFSLQSGRTIVRNRWTEIPMPMDVIKRVNSMAENTNSSRLVFGDRENNEVADNDPDNQPDSSESDNDSSDSTDTQSDKDVDEQTNVDEQGEYDQTHDKQDDIDSERDDYPAETRKWDDIVKAEKALPDQRHNETETISVRNVPVERIQKGESDNIGGVEATDEINESNLEAEAGGELNISDVPPRSLENVITTEGQIGNEGSADTTGVSLEDSMDERYGARSGRHNLRSRKKPRYDLALLAQIDRKAIAPTFSACRLAKLDTSLEPLVNILLTQYGIKKGLKVFGQSGDRAVQAEMKQLHDREVIKPKSGSALTTADRLDALKYLMFLKEKRSGTIKGRGCADGRKQRGQVTNKEKSSPTIAIEAVFLIICIAAKEERDVASVDMPGAFMQTSLKGEKIHIKFEGRMAELLSMIDPKLYRKHIIIEKGKPVLYAELCKALYGMLQAARMFWKQISGDLVGLGYEINPYDWCVCNKIINGKQHTVGWHVDDFILTHEDPSVNDDLISWFSEKYGKLTPLTVGRGKIHDYLGMKLDFNRRGKVIITMIDFIKELVEEAPSEFGGMASTPGKKHLFEVNDQCPKLEEERSITFHHFVAKSLFLSRRARPDIQLVVGFLSTRVKAPDEDDWKKLRRLVQYLRQSYELPLTLEADNSRIVKWWIDAAYAVHPDMRSQSGGTMTLGKGATYSSSVRQKLNTKSSTEAELVGVNDFMPQILWTRYFLQAQGYAMKDNVVHQDNRSAILLEENGKGSSSKRTRHINVRFFFITDRIEKGEVSVAHCPTDEMLGDFFTKPLQGAKFFNFRDKVLNIQA